MCSPHFDYLTKFSLVYLTPFGSSKTGKNKQASSFNYAIIIWLLFNAIKKLSGLQGRSELEIMLPVQDPDTISPHLG